MRPLPVRLMMPRNRPLEASARSPCPHSPTESVFVHSAKQVTDPAKIKEINHRLHLNADGTPGLACKFYAVPELISHTPKGIFHTFKAKKAHVPAKDSDPSFSVQQKLSLQLGKLSVQDQVRAHYDTHVAPQIAEKERRLEKEAAAAAASAEQQLMAEQEAALKAQAEELINLRATIDDMTRREAELKREKHAAEDEVVRLKERLSGAQRLATLECAVATEGDTLKTKLHGEHAALSETQHGLNAQMHDLLDMKHQKEQFEAATREMKSGVESAEKAKEDATKLLEKVETELRNSGLFGNSALTKAFNQGKVVPLRKEIATVKATMAEAASMKAERPRQPRPSIRPRHTRRARPRRRRRSSCEQPRPRPRRQRRRRRSSPSTRRQRRHASRGRRRGGGCRGQGGPQASGDGASGGR